MDWDVWRGIVGLGPTGGVLEAMVGVAVKVVVPMK